MTRPTSSALAAMKSSISASAVMSMPECSRRSRMRSPSGVPPGSRVTTVCRSTRAARKSSTCVDFPAPSGPSKLTNSAVTVCLVDVGRGEDAQPALRLLARAPGDQFMLRHELMLEPPDICVLRSDLLRLQRRLHLAYRVHGLVE